MNTKTKTILKLLWLWIVSVSKVNLVTFFTVSCIGYAHENGNIGGTYGLIIIGAMVLIVADVFFGLTSKVLKIKNEG